MSVVECPKCALRFEPEAVTPRVFCPQCGELFQPDTVQMVRTAAAGADYSQSLPA